MAKCSVFNRRLSRQYTQVAVRARRYWPKIERQDGASALRCCMLVSVKLRPIAV